MTIEKFKKSTSFLTVSLLVTMAFIKGELSQKIIAGIFVAWISYLVLTYAKGRLRKHRKVTNVSSSKLVLENKRLQKMFLKQLTFRVTENLRQLYPNITWTWQDKDYEERLINYESCRLKVFNADTFNFVQLRLNEDGELSFDFAKTISFNTIKNHKENKENKSLIASESSVYEWFQKEGEEQLTSIILELDEAGYEEFYLTTDGKISVDGREIRKIKMPRTKLEILEKVFSSFKLRVEAEDNCLVIAVA